MTAGVGPSSTTMLNWISERKGMDGCDLMYKDAFVFLVKCTHYYTRVLWYNIIFANQFSLEEDLMIES